MSLLYTLDHLIDNEMALLTDLAGDIREETNQEDPDIEYYCEMYDECKQRLEDLQQIKSVIEQLEANK